MSDNQKLYATRNLRPRAKVDYKESNLGKERNEKDGECSKVNHKRWSKIIMTNDYGDDLEGVDADEFSPQQLLESGFRDPVVLRESGDRRETMDALGMTLPQGKVNMDFLVDQLGPEHEVVPFDVDTQQQSRKMTMSELKSYFQTPAASREKLLNVVSLSLAGTPLTSQVSPPQIVQSMDIMNHIWPQASVSGEDLPDSFKQFQNSFLFNPENAAGSSKNVGPQVILYALVSVKNCYTDWHIDFGGSAVWYHVISGRKVFLLAPPTDQNLAAFEQWASSPEQCSTFFGDVAVGCKRVFLNRGDTLILPSGWPHAVHTPSDSIVFGGNFLHSLDLGRNLCVWHMEERLQVPNKFRFPMFRQIMWYTARWMKDRLGAQLRSQQVQGGFLDRWEYEGLFILLDSLMRWYHTDKGQADVPSDIGDPQGLLNELAMYMQYVGQFLSMSGLFGINPQTQPLSISPLLATTQQAQPTLASLISQQFQKPQQQQQQQQQQLQQQQRQQEQQSQATTTNLVPVTGQSLPTTPTTSTKVNVVQSWKAPQKSLPSTAQTMPQQTQAKKPAQRSRKRSTKSEGKESASKSSSRGGSVEKEGSGKKDGNDNRSGEIFRGNDATSVYASAFDALVDDQGHGQDDSLMQAGNELDKLLKEVGVEFTQADQLLSELGISGSHDQHLMQDLPNLSEAAAMEMDLFSDETETDIEDSGKVLSKTPSGNNDSSIIDDEADEAEQATKTPKKRGRKPKAAPKTTKAQTKAKPKAKTAARKKPSAKKTTKSKQEEEVPADFGFISKSKSEGDQEQNSIPSTPALQMFNPKDLRQNTLGGIFANRVGHESMKITDKFTVRKGDKDSRTNSEPIQAPATPLRGGQEEGWQTDQLQQVLKQQQQQVVQQQQQFLQQQLQQNDEDKPKEEPEDPKEKQTRQLISSLNGQLKHQLELQSRLQRGVLSLPDGGVRLQQTIKELKREIKQLGGVPIDQEPGFQLPSEGNIQPQIAKVEEPRDWTYQDAKGRTQGPFKVSQIRLLYEAGVLGGDKELTHFENQSFISLQDLLGGKMPRPASEKDAQINDSFNDKQRNVRDPRATRGFSEQTQGSEWRKRKRDGSSMVDPHRRVEQEIQAQEQAKKANNNKPRWSFLSKDSQECGPFSLEELKALFIKGAIGKDTLVHDENEGVSMKLAALLKIPNIPLRKTAKAQSAPSTQVGGASDSLQQPPPQQQQLNLSIKTEDRSDNKGSHEELLPYHLHVPKDPRSKENQSEKQAAFNVQDQEHIPIVSKFQVSAFQQSQQGDKRGEDQGMNLQGGVGSQKYDDALKMRDVDMDSGYVTDRGRYAFNKDDPARYEDRHRRDEGYLSERERGRGYHRDEGRWHDRQRARSRDVERKRGWEDDEDDYRYGRGKSVDPSRRHHREPEYMSERDRYSERRRQSLHSEDRYRRGEEERRSPSERDRDRDRQQYEDVHRSVRRDRDSYDGPNDSWSGKRGENWSPIRPRGNSVPPAGMSSDKIVTKQEDDDMEVDTTDSPVAKKQMLQKSQQQQHAGSNQQEPTPPPPPFAPAPLPPQPLPPQPDQAPNPLLNQQLASGNVVQQAPTVGGINPVLISPSVPSVGYSNVQPQQQIQQTPLQQQFQQPQVLQFQQGQFSGDIARLQSGIVGVGSNLQSAVGSLGTGTGTAQGLPIAAQVPQQQLLPTPEPTPKIERWSSSRIPGYEKRLPDSFLSLVNSDLPPFRYTFNHISILKGQITNLGNFQLQKGAIDAVKGQQITLERTRKNDLTVSFQAVQTPQMPVSQQAAAVPVPSAAPAPVPGIAQAAAAAPPPPNVPPQHSLQAGATIQQPAHQQLNLLPQTPIQQTPAPQPANQVAQISQQSNISQPQLQIPQVQPNLQLPQQLQAVPPKDAQQLTVPALEQHIQNHQQPQQSPATIVPQQQQQQQQQPQINMLPSSSMAQGQHLVQQQQLSTPTQLQMQQPQQQQQQPPQQFVSNVSNPVPLSITLQQQISVPNPPQVPQQQQLHMQQGQQLQQQQLPPILPPQQQILQQQPKPVLPNQVSSQQQQMIPPIPQQKALPPLQSPEQMQADMQPMLPPQIPQLQRPQLGAPPPQIFPQQQQQLFQQQQQQLPQQMMGVQQFPQQPQQFPQIHLQQQIQLHQPQLSVLPHQRQAMLVITPQQQMLQQQQQQLEQLRQQGRQQ